MLGQSNLGRFMNRLMGEKYDNWLVERDNDFSCLGISSRKLTLAEALYESGLLFNDVSGKSCFSDIRKAASSELRKQKIQYDYEEPFSMENRYSACSNTGGEYLGSLHA